MGSSRVRWVGGAVVACVALPQVAHAERVVYLNLDPTALINTNDQDPVTNSYTSAGFTPGQIAGWPTLSQPQQGLMLFWLKEATAPFDISFTFARPAAGPYDMVVFGTEANNTALFPTTGCSAAIGLADCDDASAENISFLFYGCLAAGQEDDMRRVAFNTLVAAGFSWGLENEMSNGQVMGSYSVFGLEFGTTCVEVTGGGCTHAGCPGGQQNASADLTALIGARIDDGPATLSITTPADLSDVNPDFDVVADVSDKFGGLAVTLDILEAGSEEITLSTPRSEPPYEWSLTNVPPGAWTLRVTVSDADANITTEEVVVCIDVANCPDGAVTTGMGSTTTGGDETDGSSTSGEPGGTTSTSTTTVDGSSTGAGTGEGTTNAGPIDPTAPLDPADFGETGTGCNCITAPDHNPASGWALLMMLMVGLRRRRPAAV